MTSKQQNAGNSREIRDAKRIRRYRVEQEIADLRAVLATAAGRRFIFARIQKCNVMGQIWDPSRRFDFNEGRRDVGIELMRDLAAIDPHAYIQMLADDYRAQQLAPAPETMPPADAGEGDSEEMP